MRLLLVKHLVIQQPAGNMRETRILLSFISLWNIVTLCNTAKILAVIAVPSFSHQAFFRPLWREYIRLGHELTLITTNPMPSEDHHSNLRQIDVSMVYDAAEPQFQRMIDLRNDKLGEINFFFEYVLNATRRELLHSEVQALFTDPSANFDLLLIEDIAPQMYVFKERFDVPCIAVASFDVPSWTHEIVGNPTHPLLYPNAAIPMNSLPSGILKRFVAVLFEFVLRKYYQHSIITKMDRMIMETVPGNYPSVLELQQRVDMLFTNANPVFSKIRPYAQTTVSLAGGFHTAQTKNITGDLLAFLDSSPEGVIYFSLGTNVKGNLLSENLLTTFIETFRQLPYKILWKFETDSMTNLPANVKITKWCPQQAVLRHKHLKVFVNQAGLQSLEESILSGVPVVTMPFFLDQQANAEQVVANGIGVELMYETLTVTEFKTAILEVINNEKYKNTAKQFARLIMDKPLTPLQEAIWNTEYLLRHGSAKHLKPFDIPSYQYYYLDVIGAIIFVICFSGYFLYCCICFVANMLLNQKKTVDKRKIKKQ